MKDTVIRDLLKDISGPVEVDVPKEHHTSSWRIDGKDQDPQGGYIPAGKQKLDAHQAMRLILAEDKKPNGKEDERSYRKNLILKAAKDLIFPKLAEKSVPLAKLFIQNLWTQDLTLDPNIDSNLFLELLKSLPGSLKKYDREDLAFPDLDPKQEFVFHDAHFGDGGVVRVHNIKDRADTYMQASLPIRQQVDLIRQQKGVENPELMPDWMLIPEGGDPTQQDLVKHYWRSMRELVKRKLSTTN